jgi:pimeloyl-ACP methyl ester carboxylesterase
VATIVGFTRERAAARIAALRRPRQARSWRSWQERTRHELAGILRLPDPTPPRWTQAVIDGVSEKWTGEPEPGITLEARFYSPTAPKRGPAVLLLHPDGQATAAKMPLLARLRERRVRVLTLDLRGTGASASPESALADIPDHSLCEHALWVGRPLMGQWVVDVRAAISLLEQHPQVDPTRIHLLGWGEAGLLALIVAALEPRISGAVAAHSLASYVSDSRFHEQRMVVMVPDLLRACDVAHLAALVAPRPLALLRPVRADGAPAGHDDLEQAAEWPRAAYRLLGEAGHLHAALDADDDRVLEALGL